MQAHSVDVCGVWLDVWFGNVSTPLSLLMFDLLDDLRMSE